MKAESQARVIHTHKIHKPAESSLWLTKKTSHQFVFGEYIRSVSHLFSCLSRLTRSASTLQHHILYTVWLFFFFICPILQTLLVCVYFLCFCNSLWRYSHMCPKLTDTQRAVRFGNLRKVHFLI